MLRPKTPLVLVHGGLGNDLSWGSLLPVLTDSFTCYRMSTRGRGLSAEPADADFSLERLVEDIVGFTESVGEPAGLVGHSLGGALVLGAAARCRSYTCVDHEHRRPGTHRQHATSPNT